MRHRLLFLPVLLLFPNVTAAQWIPDGIPISTAVESQYTPRMGTDGAGGFIIGWADLRDGAADAYVQKIDAAGVVQWTTNGISVSSNPFGQGAPFAVPDGNGGAIVFWNDERYHQYDPDLYAQRLDTHGNPLWTEGGVVVSDALYDQGIWHRPAVSDGVGGAIVVWIDRRSWPMFRIYAQRIDGQGNSLWTEDGVEVSPSLTGTQSAPFVIEDGAAGVVVVWGDTRVQGVEADVYAQRLDALGVPQWFTGPNSGVVLCAETGHQILAGVTSDGAGVVAVWEDERKGYETDVYAQRVNFDGTPQWMPNGVAVCAQPFAQSAVSVADDGEGGTLVAWQDRRTNQFLFEDIYAQRLDADGVAVWAADGAPVCITASPQETPQIASDGTGGAYIVWTEVEASYDVFSQHLDGNGAPKWPTAGVPTCTASGYQTPGPMLPDGAGGAIVAWADWRSGPADIYAQHLSDAPTAVAITSFDAIAHDGAVTLRSTFRSDLEVEVVNVYRGVGSNTGSLAIIGRVYDADGSAFVYEDAHVTPGEAYRYQIGVKDADGEFFSPVARVTVDAMTLQLEQNHPNPFNPSTTIHFVLPSREHVTIVIYDATGVVVRTIFDDVREHGGHDVTWDGRDDQGVRVGSGVYFYRLTAGKHVESKKMVLLK